ncbi:MAG: M35 family metallo-endopeptidase, partial [Waterburya sp.]
SFMLNKESREFVDGLDEEEFEEEAIAEFFNNEWESEIEILPELPDELEDEEFDEGETTVRKTTENKFENCTKKQKDLIQQASEKARKDVTWAATVIGSAYGRPDKMSVKTRKLLKKHFHTTDRDNLGKIRSKLTSIQQALEKGVSFECEKECKRSPDNKCQPGYAYKTQWFGGFGDVHICFDTRCGGCNFADTKPYLQEVIIIREVGHRYVGLDDHAYLYQEKYSKLSPKQAINNADSYAGFSVDLSRNNTNLSHEFLDKLDEDDELEIEEFEKFEEETEEQIPPQIATYDDKLGEVLQKLKPKDFAAPHHSIKGLFDPDYWTVKPDPAYQKMLVLKPGINPSTAIKAIVDKSSTK